MRTAVCLLPAAVSEAEAREKAASIDTSPPQSFEAGDSGAGALGE